MNLLDISEVSRRSGVKPSALRFYEEAGLIASVSRHGLRRQFPSDVLVRLSLISMGRSAGFSLGEIVELLAAGDIGDLPRDRFHQKAEELDRQIRNLTALRDTLRHVADCPAATHAKCPTFKRLVRVAGRHQRMRRKATGSLRKGVC